MVVSGCLMAWYWNPFAGCSRLRFLLIATQVEQSDRRCTAPQMHPLRNSPEIAQIQVNKSPLNLDLRVLGDTIFAISSPLSLNNFFCDFFAHSFKCLYVYMSICLYVYMLDASGTLSVSLSLSLSLSLCVLLWLLNSFHHKLSEYGVCKAYEQR